MLEVLQEVLVGDCSAEMLGSAVHLSAHGEILSVGANLVEGSHCAVHGILVALVIITFFIAGRAAEAVVNGCLCW